MTEKNDRCHHLQKFQSQNYIISKTIFDSILNEKIVILVKSGVKASILIKQIKIIL